LRDALPAVRDPRPLQELLGEVDAALGRMETGAYGLCETCREPIEDDRLLADPLCRNCLDHLSAEEQRRLERDLDLAFQVQQGLLPKAGPVAPGWSMAYHYRPAGPVSGDYCDLIPTEDGTPVFVVGDVMGKGVAASMLTAHLHAIFRSLSTLTRSPGELVARANRVFREGTLSEFFATVVCGRLGPDGDVEICNAGHCHPLHVGADGVARVDSTGLPLGLFDGAEYSSSRLVLRPGDSLLVHTDGLSEAANSDGEEYGVGRLAGVLRRQAEATPERILAALLDDVGRFVGGTPILDDLTMMVLRRGE
jgi:sigma-B regulation protein RsbU (phosphoserine phosphatase)